MECPKRRVLVAPLLISVLVSGCLIDFDQFGTERSDTDGFTADDMDGDSPDSDAGRPETDGGLSHGDMDIDVGANPVDPEVGTACTSDDDCGSGTCWNGYCTRTCETTSDCPSSVCANVAGESLCVLPCAEADDSCDDGLACESVVTSEEPGRARACLPDTDADTVADIADNCPSNPNATQRDLDVDGLGDACDDDLVCAMGHTDGIRTLGPVAFEGTNPGAPDYAGDWMVIAGGSTADGLSNAALVIDRASGEVRETALPYAANSFAAAPLGGDEFLLTPGSFGGEGQFGRFLHVSRDGSVRVGSRFDISDGAGAVFDPTLAVGADGSIWMHAFDDEAITGSTSWTLYRYDLENQTFEPVTGGDERARVSWLVTTDIEGRIHFYSGPVDPLFGVSRIVTVLPGGAVRSNVVFYPDLGTGSPFEPLLVPAPGGFFYVYDRPTGRAFAFDGTNVGAEILELAIVNDLLDARWISHPSGPGFTIIGRTEADPTMVEARSYSLPCLPSAAALDTDADGFIDPVDLCKFDDLAEQTDADEDWIGDACDADADGDGVSDANESVPGIDTDDDGKTNDVDDDDDNDGILDIEDRWPLDTDNDGVSNAFDPDDDDDGYSDLEEVSAGTDSTHPLSFPGSGKILWNTGGKTWLAPLHDAGNPSELAGANGAPTYNPRFADLGASVLVVAGMPGVATTLQLLDTSGMGPLAEYDVGVPVIGADPVVAGGGTLTRAIVSRVDDVDPTRTLLAEYDAVTGNLRTIADVVTDIGVPDYSNGTVAFLASLPGCPSCRSAYAMPSSGGVPRLVGSNVSNPTVVRYTGGRYALVGDAQAGTGTAVWTATDGLAVETNPTLVTDANSVVGSADGHLVVSTTDENGHALWFFNSLKNRWHRLATTVEPAASLDWTR